MPRAWLHRQTRRTMRMQAELTMLRSNNPANEHPKFSLGESSRVAAHRKRRLVSQNGRIKVTNTNVPGKHERYFGDLFTTILDMPFHWILGIYSLVYLASWSGFGTVWYVIHHLREINGYEEFYCVDNVDSWTTAFLFSIETQTTIGYGGRQVTSNCPEGVVLLLIQTLVGSFIAATLLGIVFAKASRPKKRSRTVLFSEKAVIGKRDDRLCLMFRVADLRASQLLECHIQVEMFYTRETNEGELPYFHERLSIGNGISEGEEIYYTFMIIPNTIAHVIHENSPLYAMSSLDMLKANVELVVFLEGVIESTGLTMQARTSYTAHEIVWGCNFAPIPRHDDLVFKGELTVDFCHFNKLEKVTNMPVCSARDYERLKEERRGTQSVSSGVEEDDDSNNGTIGENHEHDATRGVRIGNDSTLEVNKEHNGTHDKNGVSSKSNDRCEVIPNGLVTNPLPETSGGILDTTQETEDDVACEHAV